MSTCNSTRASCPLALRTVAPRNGSRPFPFPRIYRAHISAPSVYGAERTAFVEAAGHRDAVRKIAAAVAALETRLPETVEERIYNCASARELIEDGSSEDIELRLFETGWCGNDAVSFVTEPLFLLAAPASLIRKWAQISEVRHV
jgi:hypothetical protein